MKIHRVQAKVLALGKIIGKRAAELAFRLSALDVGNVDLGQPDGTHFAGDTAPAGASP